MYTYILYICNVIFHGIFLKGLGSVGSCPEHPERRQRFGAGTPGTPGCAKQWLEDGVA